MRFVARVIYAAGGIALASGVINAFKGEPSAISLALGLGIVLGAIAGIFDDPT